MTPPKENGLAAAVAAGFLSPKEKLGCVVAGCGCGGWLLPPPKVNKLVGGAAAPAGSSFPNTPLVLEAFVIGIEKVEPDVVVAGG